MTEKIYQTPLGNIHYWIHMKEKSGITLVFLPGLTADHRLFDKQVEYFKDKYNVIVWDAPAHGASWPFVFSFDLTDKARWLRGILHQEDVKYPVIVGQSMGGYLGQMFSELYPETLTGFVSIDSAPMQRKYVTNMEIWLMKRMEKIFGLYSWKTLMRSSINGVSVTKYGKDLMREMLLTYEGDKKRFDKISGHGLNMLAEAMEKDLPYEIKCPAVIVCGKKDRAGSAVRHTKLWHKGSGIPVAWIENAGHNANADQPEAVNQEIEKVIRKALGV